MDVLAACPEDPFEDFVARNRAGIVYDAYRVTHQREDAEDIAQEMLLRAFAHRYEFVAEGGMRSWLRTVTRNAAIDLRRRRQRTERELPATNEAGDLCDPQTQFIRVEEASTVRGVLATLPIKYRDVLELYYAFGFTYAEIATLRKLPLNTIKTHMLRAKQLVAAKLTRS